MRSKLVLFHTKSTLYPEVSGDRLEACYVKLYRNMIEGIDAMDALLLRRKACH